MTLTPKEQYQVFKFFKDTYTKINSAKKIQILSNLDIILSGCKNGEFFIFSGKILGENPFFEYLKTNNLNTEITVEQWKKLAECLKKNIKDIEFNLDYVLLAIFKFKGSDGSDEEVSLELTLDAPDTTNIDRIKGLLSEKKDITNVINQPEILELFLDEHENVVGTKTGTKLLEIPKNRILSFLKDSKSYYISYSKKLKEEIRYVALSSNNELIELTQIFATL